MKKQHLFLVFIGIFVAMFICFCSMASNYVEAITKYDSAKSYIERLEADFPQFIDITSGSDEYSNYYNNN